MVKSSKGGSGKVTFRDKAAVVYSPKTSLTGNSSVSVDRGFTVRFSEADKSELAEERSSIRDRLKSNR